jgi:tripartite-type tricarboxylate transporter receptor subunit TctC
MRPAILSLVAGLIAASCIGHPAFAQPAYPQKTIRLLVGAVPGGATDILARVIGQKLAENLRQQVVIENRPGANQILAAEMTAKSAPDGYTLLMVPSGFAINPSIYRKLPFDPVRDFTAIAIAADVPNVLVIHPSLPARSVRDFIALARAHPGQLSYGSSGVGSPSHLCGEVFKMMTKVSFVHVPYKGSGQSVIDLIGGHLQLSFPSIPASMPHIRSGKLRPLGVTILRRSSSLPDVPTIDEGGVKGYEVSGWYGILGPANMPRDVVQLLNNEIIRALRSADVRDSLLGQGAEPVGSKPEEFAGIIAADLVKWSRVVKTVGLQPE